MGGVGKPQRRLVHPGKSQGSIASRFADETGHEKTSHTEGQNVMDAFRNKVVLITGGSYGLGAAAFLRFACDGASVGARRVEL
jgi:hypothetical protein